MILIYLIISDNEAGFVEVFNSGVITEVERLSCVNYIFKTLNSKYLKLILENGFDLDGGISEEIFIESFLKKNYEFSSIIVNFLEKKTMNSE